MLDGGFSFFSTLSFILLTKFLSILLFIGIWKVFDERSDLCRHLIRSGEVGKSAWTFFHCTCQVVVIKDAFEWVQE